MGFRKLFSVGSGQDSLTVMSIYPQYLGVVFASPPGMSHLAHVTYLKEGSQVNTNRGSIDYFLAGRGFENKNFPKTTPIHFVRQELSEPERAIERNHRINYEIPNSAREFEQAVRRVAIFDVWDFYNKPNYRKPSLEPADAQVNYVEQVLSKVRPQARGHVNIDGLWGKQAFEPECLADLNSDVVHWCITSVTDDWKLSPQLGCDLCYAAYKHKGYPYYATVNREKFVAQINALTKLRASDRDEEGKPKTPLPTRYLRISKLTEAGHPLFRKELITTLEACADTGIHAFMPTKFLEYDPQVAELFRKTDSTLLISLGNPKLETGANLRGRTNEVRIADGLRYLDAGVRVVPYVLVNALEEFGGEGFSDNLVKVLDLPFQGIQLLPARIRYRKHQEIIGGWDSVVGERGIDLLGQACGGCDVTGDSTRLVNQPHESLVNLIGDNTGRVRMCHHSKDCGWCGKCFMSGEKGWMGAREKIILGRSQLDVKRQPAKEKDDGHPQFDFKPVQATLSF